MVVVVSWVGSLGTVLFLVMFITALIAKICIFFKCHKNKTKKYYCNNDKCLFCFYCLKYRDEMGRALQSFAECEKRQKEKEATD